LTKALIEVDFPLKEVSEESVREKNIRHGHISTLHIWWARRPLAASRSTIFAALTPEPKDRDELKKKLSFVTELSKWENSLNQTIMDEARKLILEANDGKPPKVLDCFAGGGAIPLEALRLGCETYALEYNPVAVLILKAVLEYPQKYGRRRIESKEGLTPVYSNPLVEDVKKWGNWVLQEARKEVGRFYPSDPDGSIPVGYIWARTVRCQNPSCGAEIPLLHQFWLAKKENKKVALKLIPHKRTKTIEFRIVQGKEIDFDPSQGTTSRATVLCPVCGGGIAGDTVRKEAKEDRMGQRLIAVVLRKTGREGKTYRVARDEDVDVFKKAERYLDGKAKNWKWGLSPMPDEPTPSGEGPGAERAFSIRKYGLDSWGDLFNARQKLALVTFVENIKEVYARMIAENHDSEYVKVLMTYLGLNFDTFATYLSSLTRYRGDTQSIERSFDRQAVQMVWDYGEVNPFGGSRGDWNNLLIWMLRAVEHCTRAFSNSGTVLLGTATRLPYPDSSFDAVLTDPPYYDNVPYSDLSDFFYVWLKRTVGELYPDLFATPLTPKSQEIVMHTLRHGNSIEKAKEFFEGMITESFKEIYRILRTEGIATVVFAYKSTDAWETIISSLLKSGLVLTASWPIHTEMKARLRAMESAALASSVYMVCRKRGEEETAYFNELRDEIDRCVKEKLEQFWEQGISGADFFVSAIGPAVEVFGKYSRVEKLSGEEVSVKELLEYVRKVVSEFALGRILKRPDLGGVDATTRFYLLWRWTFNNARVHFDDARKITQSVGGIELTEMWGGSGLVRKEKEYVRVLGPKDRVFSRKEKLSTMIDALHQAVVLWEKGDRKKLQEMLEEAGYLRSEVFWQVAQAISDVLPEGDKEKQLIQGFLYGKDTYVKESHEKDLTLLDYMKNERKE